MLKFPRLPDLKEAPLPRMSLPDYARFSESCSKLSRSLAHTSIDASKADEKVIRKPFRLVPAAH